MEYSYQRERRQFGKQCHFTDRNNVLFSEGSDRDMFKQYILRDPVHQTTQYGKQMAFSEVNTERATYESHGVNHTEGGWPKDVNLLDPEQTTRYRRKMVYDRLPRSFRVYFDLHVNRLFCFRKKMNCFLPKSWH